MKSIVENLSLKAIFSLLETPFIVFDLNYDVRLYSKSARKIIMKNASIKDIINKQYWTIINNGVENRFPFVVIEKRSFNCPVFTTIDFSYKLVIKPIIKNMFLMECIEIDSIKKANTVLLERDKQLIKKSHILNNLIKLKLKNLNIENKNTDEIISLYKEQLEFQFSMDDAIGDIIEPLISTTSTINYISEIILKKLKQLTGSKAGIVVSQEYFTDKFSVLEYYKDEDILIELDHYCDLLEHVMRYNELFYINNIHEVDKENLEGILHTNNVKNLLTIPVYRDDVKIGQIILLNSSRGFNEFDLKFTNRLAQFFALAYERKKIIIELERYANTDTMTGCINRRTGITMLEKLYEISNRYNRVFSIIFMDINNLKFVNDTFGHNFGDDLIISVASIIQRLLRQSDIFIRLGGDEFLLVLPDTDYSEAQIVADKIEKEINDYNKEDKKPYEMSISLGLVEHTKYSDLNVDQLIEKADMLMYENKRVYKEQAKYNI